MCFYRRWQHRSPTVLFTPFSIAIYTVLYYELRARNEGFDLTQRAHQLLSPSD